jgi:hypothetical protein
MATLRKTAILERNMATSRKNNFFRLEIAVKVGG